MGPTELAVGVEGDGASCACSRYGGRRGPPVIAVGVEGDGAY